MAIRVTQVKSKIGHTREHRGTLRALGLGRIGQTAVHEDSPSLRGMLHSVAFLIKVDEGETAEKKAAGWKSRSASVCTTSRRRLAPRRSASGSDAGRAAARARPRAAVRRVRRRARART